MSTNILKYPLDLTGESPTNYVDGEDHTIELERNRIIVPDYGAYFTESLVVTHNGVPLKRGVDYRCIGLAVEQTFDAKKEICLAIEIINPEIVGTITITYQALGGNDSVSVPVLSSLLNELLENPVSISWNNVLNKPLRFTPAAHLHSIYDTFGYENLISVMEDIFNAIIAGDTGGHMAIESKIAALRSEYENTRTNLTGRVTILEQQIADTSGSYDDLLAQHNQDIAAINLRIDDLNPGDVGLGNVSNYSLATQPIAQAHTSNSYYLTPLSGYWMAEASFSKLGHTHNVDQVSGAVPDTLEINGHALTSSFNITQRDIGLNNVANLPRANQAQAEAHVTNEAYLTPLSGYWMAQASFSKLGHTHTVSQVSGAVPETRTINNHPLSSNVTLTLNDLGISLAELGVWELVETFTGTGTDYEFISTHGPVAGYEYMVDCTMDGTNYGGQGVISLMYRTYPTEYRFEILVQGGSSTRALGVYLRQGSFRFDTPHGNPNVPIALWRRRIPGYNTATISWLSDTTARPSNPIVLSS